MATGSSRNSSRAKVATPRTGKTKAQPAKKNTNIEALGTRRSPRKRDASPLAASRAPASKRTKKDTTATSTATAKAPKTARQKPADIDSESEEVESASEDDLGENDDDDLEGLDGDAVEQRLVSERAHITPASKNAPHARRLFEHDSDVEVIVKGKPALSTASELEDDVDDDEEVIDQESGNEGNKLSGRARARLNEVPKFTHRQTPRPYLDLEDHGINVGWNAQSHYEPPERASGLLLVKSQPIPVMNTLKAAIRQVTGDTIFIDAYPSVDSGTFDTYHRTVLVDCARRLHYPLLAERLRKDDQLLKHAAATLNGRVSLVRSQCHQVTDTKVEGYYLCGGDPEFPARVKELTNEKMDYLYPSKANSDLDTNRPFFHPAIISAMKKFFFTGDRGTLAAKHDSRFSSSIAAPDKRHEEREVPISMVSLVAAMIHASLTLYTGDSSSTIRTAFSAEMYEDTYRGHVMFLQDLKRSKPNLFHRNMHDLYNAVAGKKTKSVVTIARNTMCRITIEDDIEI